MQKDNLTNGDLPLPIPIARIDWTKYPNAGEPVRRSAQRSRCDPGATQFSSCNCPPQTVPARRD